MAARSGELHISALGAARVGVERVGQSFIAVRDIEQYLPGLWDGYPLCVGSRVSCKSPIAFGVVLTVAHPIPPMPC
jgi:hypothetical protein